MDDEAVWRGQSWVEGTGGQSRGQQLEEYGTGPESSVGRWQGRWSWEAGRERAQQRSQSWGQGIRTGGSRGCRAGGEVRPRVDRIRDHCGGHSSVVPVWLSSLPTCFLPGSYNLSELSFPL